MIPGKAGLRRRKAVLGHQDGWSHDQLVEQLRQVIGISLAAHVAARLLDRRGAWRLSCVWSSIEDELLRESLVDVFVHPVALGVDRGGALTEALAATEADTTIMIARGMEIASGGVEGGVRCLLSVGNIDEFWGRVRSAARTVTDASPDYPEGRAESARPSRSRTRRIR